MRNLIKKILRESDDLSWMDDIDPLRIVSEDVQVGDRVRVTHLIYDRITEVYMEQSGNTIGTITSVDVNISEDFWVGVRWDNNHINTYPITHLLEA